jgi:hypothetical protein
VTSDKKIQDLRTAVKESRRQLADHVRDKESSEKAQTGSQVSRGQKLADDHDKAGRQLAVAESERRVADAAQRRKKQTDDIAGHQAQLRLEAQERREQRAKRDGAKPKR